MQVQYSQDSTYSGTTTENKGLHVTSDVSVSVVAINTANEGYSMDMFLVFPTSALGSTYFAVTGNPFLYSERFSPLACQTIAVSLADNTVVTVTKVDGTNEQV